MQVIKIARAAVGRARPMLLLVALGVAGCATLPADPADSLAATRDRDRAAILAMAGEFEVSFDFIETVALAPDYGLRPRKQSGGHELVLVLADAADFVSLQHLLVVETERGPVTVKHWRQDWRWQPASVLVYRGGNAWQTRAVPPAERAGSWSQQVYQVDDSPRYGAVGRWHHAAGVSEWQPDREWRPLPRRDATTRDDYDVIDAVNRHTITAAGWVHEQDNTKLALVAGARPLVREVGVNTYRRAPVPSVEAAHDYWRATAAFWRTVRSRWTALEAAGRPFGLTVQGEPEALYAALLGIAAEVAGDALPASQAQARVDAVLARFVTDTPAPLEQRLGPRPAPQAALGR